MRSILVVDPDRNSRAGLCEYLRKEGYRVYYSNRAKPGMDKAREKRPDLIIMESAFQDADEFELLRLVKSDGLILNTPVIIVSRQSDDLSKVLAFELGADDYVEKPAGLKELAARIRVQLKYLRMAKTEPEKERVKILKYGDITLSPYENEVCVNGHKLVFSVKEFKILSILLAARGKAVERGHMIRRVWGDTAEISPKTLSVYINNIRRRIIPKTRYHFYVHAVGKTGFRLELKERDETA